MQNLMGTELTEAEAELAACYTALLAVLENHGEELAPFARRNAVKAAGALWQVMNGLDLDPGQRYEVGV